MQEVMNFEVDVHSCGAEQKEKFMKKIFFGLCVSAWLTRGSCVLAQVPQLLNYQGRVAVAGTNFTGTGQFQFALVDANGTTTYWSNGVGTVALAVNKGLYAVLLGDTTVVNMAAIPVSVFTNSDVRLRVAFDGGVGLQTFTPDQRLAAVGWAFNAAQAQTALAVSADANGVVKLGTNMLALTGGTLLLNGQPLAGGGVVGSYVSSFNGMTGDVFGASMVALTATANAITNASSTSFHSVNVQTNLMIGEALINTYAPEGSERLNIWIGGGGQLSTNSGAAHNGSHNVAVGTDALLKNTLGVANVAVGTRSLYQNTSGQFNTGVGCYALSNNITGGQNSAFGANAIRFLSGNSDNNAFGCNALQFLVNGYENSAFGAHCFEYMSNGSYNTGVGVGIAGITNGNNNTLIGANILMATDVSGYVVLADGTGKQRLIFDGNGNGVISNGLTVLGALTLGSNQFVKSVTVNGVAYALDGSGNINLGTLAGGGANNTNSGLYAAVGGGYSNVASNSYATIPGGYQNVAGGQYSLAAGRQAKATNEGAFVWADSQSSDFFSTASNQMSFRVSGGLRIFTDSAATLGVQLSPNATAWTTLSDRNAKENILPVNPRAILEHLAQLPMYGWSYKADPTQRRYIGPMAQDFHAAFGLGDDDKRINGLDTDGVTLAAIQGLYAVVKEKDARIAELEKRLAELERLLKRSGN